MGPWARATRGGACGWACARVAGGRARGWQLAAGALGGGQAAAKKLRAAGFLTSGIGLPVTPVDGDANGLRLGTPEVVRRGVGPDHAGAIAALFSAALKSNAPETLAGETAALRQEFGGLYFIHRDA